MGRDYSRGEVFTAGILTGAFFAVGGVKAGAEFRGHVLDEATDSTEVRISGLTAEQRSDLGLNPTEIIDPSEVSEVDGLELPAMPDYVKSGGTHNFPSAEINVDDLPSLNTEQREQVLKASLVVQSEFEDGPSGSSGFLLNLGNGVVRAVFAGHAAVKNSEFGNVSIYNRNGLELPARQIDAEFIVNETREIRTDGTSKIVKTERIEDLAWADIAMDESSLDEYDTNLLEIRDLDDEPLQLGESLTIVSINNSDNYARPDFFRAVVAEDYGSEGDEISDSERRFVKVIDGIDDSSPYYQGDGFTDNFANYGNSGAVVVDSAGRAVGVHTASIEARTDEQRENIPCERIAWPDKGDGRGFLSLKIKTGADECTDNKFGHIAVMRALDTEALELLDSDS